MPDLFFSRRIGNLRRALRRSFEAAVGPHDITATQFQVLRRLWDGDGLNAQTLSKQAMLDAATMTGVLDRLESKGLLRREKDTLDRRAVRIFLTDSGRELEGPLNSVLEKINDVALAGLKEKERDQLFALLDRVERNLEAYERKEDSYGRNSPQTAEK